MSDEDIRRRAHNLDVTVWVGKGGIESTIDEFNDQLSNNELVKVKFHRSARGGTSTEGLADDLADRADAELVYVRGHTAVYQ